MYKKNGVICISIARNLQAFVVIILIVLAILVIVLSMVPVYNSKLFDDNDQVGANMFLANDTGKGYYNEGEEISISLSNNEVGRTLQLRVTIASATENLTIYFLTSSNYLTWNGSAENVTVLSAYAFGNASIPNGTRTAIEAIPSIISYSAIPLSFYIVITNASALSGDYEIADVDITFYSTMLKTFDMSYGLFFIVAAVLVIYVPYFVKKKMKQRKERKEAEKKQPAPTDLTLQEVVHEDIKPERERIVDLDPNKKICSRCGSKVDISVDVCTTCGNKF